MSRTKTCSIAFFGIIVSLLISKICFSQGAHLIEKSSTNYLDNINSYESRLWPHYKYDNKILNIIAIDSTVSQDSTKKQIKKEDELNANFSTSVQYQRLSNGWNVGYYGVHLEAYINNRFSISGQIYAGTASDNKTYLHIPSAGIILLITSKIFSAIVFDESPPTFTEYLILALTENIHYNLYYQNNKVIVSPYINIFGFDAGFSEEPDENKTLISNGLGLNIKLLPMKHFTISSFFTIKYFSSIGDTFDSKDHLGYGAGLDIGFIF